MDDLFQQVVDKAERAVAQLSDQSNAALDYSESSLSAVETMLTEAAGLTGQMPDGQIDGLVRILGSYVLEVGRREFGGKYYWFEEREQPVLVIGEPDYKIAVLAFDKVRGRLFRDQAETLPYFYQRFAESVRTADSGIDVLYD